MLSFTRSIITSFLFLIPFVSPAITIKGYVFVDKNHNGIRDAKDSGVKGAVLSDQIITTTTNEDGYYEFESNSNYGVYFLIQPNGFKIKDTFWKALPKDQAEFTYDFQVIPLPNTTKFTFIHASDPHLSQASLERFQKFRHKVDSIIPSFVIISGDLIKDALRVSEKEASDLYKLYASEIEKFKVPVYNAPGNHDLFGIERNASGVEKSNPLYGKEMYRLYLGPDYYSFNYCGVHFIGLNTADYHDQFYYGHVDSTQLNWLKKDISSIKKFIPIVTYNHFPLFSGGLSMWGYMENEPGASLIEINGQKYFRHVVSNANEVMDCLKNNSFPLALSGHYHAAQKFSFYGRETRFNQTGALISNGQMSGMTLPSGFTLYTVVNGKINDGEFIPLK